MYASKLITVLVACFNDLAVDLEAQKISYMMK